MEVFLLNIVFIRLKGENICATAKAEITVIRRYMYT